jgi:predicted phosphodiesterase
MKRSAALLLLFLSVIGLAAYPAPFDHGPYSGAPTADGVTISWLSSPPNPATVDVGPASAFDADGSFAMHFDVPPAAPDLRGPVNLPLTGLDPATKYVYRVTVQSGSERFESPVGYFRTEPALGEPVSFAVISDTQWQWEGENRLKVIGDAVADDPNAGSWDFILHAGDLVESPSSLYWDQWFDSFDRMLLVAPFIPVLGNHEKNSISYYENFVHPVGGGQGNERWWALHWGDVVVVGLDTNAARADRIIAQQKWAEEQLSGPETHKFVIFHHPVYSSDAYHGSGYGYDVIYHPIFVRTGVDVVFNGHAHNYERIEKDGVTYLVVGGGGAVPRELLPEHVPGSIVAVQGENFYVRVETNPEGIGVQVVSVAKATDTTFIPTNGERIDDFFLPTVHTQHPATSWSSVIGCIGILGIALWALLRP